MKFNGREISHEDKRDYDRRHGPYKAKKKARARDKIAKLSRKKNR
jgi:hypothetical protein